MTIEKLWGFYRAATAPTPRAVRLVKRVWNDARDVAGIVNEVLPAPVSSPGAPGKESDQDEA